VRSRSNHPRLKEKKTSSNKQIILQSSSKLFLKQTSIAISPCFKLLIMIIHKKIIKHRIKIPTKENKINRINSSIENLNRH